MNNPLVQPDPGLAIWTIVTFLVLLWLLAKFAWRPLLQMLETRQETIRKSLDDAQQARLQVEMLGKESDRILKQAHVEADAIVAASRADAEHIAVATVQRVDMLVSWNFKHIVKLSRIRAFNAVNLKLGYPALEIRSPLEVAYEETEDF